MKHIKGVGQKMTKNGREMNCSYYSFRWISLYLLSKLYEIYYNEKIPNWYPMLVGLLIKLRLIKFTSSMKLLEPFGTWKFNKTAIMRFLRTVLCMEGQWEFLLLKAEFIIRLYIGSRIRKQSSFFLVDLSPDLQVRLSES